MIALLCWALIAGPDHDDADDEKAHSGLLEDD